MTKHLLTRFHQAQESSWGGFATARAELLAGRKTGHWIWYIFPQLTGLGSSSTARHYSLRGLSETRGYLEDPVLFYRYLELATIVARQLAAGIPLEELMGSEIDAMKLVSSVTLFHAASALPPADVALTDSHARLRLACERILAAAAREGRPACAFTLERLAAGEGTGGNDED